MMTLLSTGKVVWPTHTIISKETRLWLGIDDESCKLIATADLKQTVLDGLRTFTNLSAHEQWLSIHQCIDDMCPIHHIDEYIKPALRRNEEDEFQIKEIANGLSEGNTNNNLLNENAKCRRQLFGDDDFGADQTGGVMQKMNQYGDHVTSHDPANEDQVPAIRSSSALHQIFINYNRLEHSAHDDSPSSQESTTHEHITSNLEFKVKQTSEPRFMCTWLNDHVSIDKYPLYKLSVLHAGTEQTKRESLGVFPTRITDHIWTSHKYIGDVGNERLESDKIPNSTCIKTKSFECCINETTASVLKDICDVDISDLKTKYNFLFDPTYIFKTTDIAKHCGMKRLGGQCSNITQQCHAGSESKVVSEVPVDIYSHDYANDSLNHVELTNDYIQTGKTTGFQCESQATGHVAVHHYLNYLKADTMDRIGSLTDPRLNECSKNVTNWLNYNHICSQSPYVSPDMCSKVNGHVMSKNSKDCKWYGSNSDQSPYTMSPLSLNGALNPNLCSPLVDGYCFSPSNQMELIPLAQDCNNGSSEQDYFSQFNKRIMYQSPRVESVDATKALQPDEQQCFQSPNHLDYTYAKGMYCDIPLSNSIGQSPYQNKRYERSIISLSRSTTSQDRTRSHRDSHRSYKRCADCDDDLKKRPRRSGTHTRHKQFGYRSCDKRSEKQFDEQQTDSFQSHEANHEDDSGMFNPIPRYLMDFISQAKDNNYNERTSRHSSYDGYRSPSCDRKRSKYFRLGCSSRDQISQDVSRSRIGQTSSLGKYWTTVDCPKSGYSREYLYDRRRRSEHKYKRDYKSTTISRSRTRSRSRVSRSPRSKTQHSHMSRSHSKQLTEHKEHESSFSINRSSGRNMDTLVSSSVGRRRHGDIPN